MNVKQCSQQQLDFILNKRRVWIGKLEYSTGIYHFAFNYLREECYMSYDIDENVEYGYEIVESNILRGFIYKNIVYELAAERRKKTRTPIQKNLTTVMDTADIMKRNDELREIVQLESAIATFCFFMNRDAMENVGVDEEHGSHILSSELIVEPDEGDLSNIDALVEGWLSADIPAAPQKSKTIILPFKRERKKD